MALETINHDLFGEVLCMLEPKDALRLATASDELKALAAQTVSPWQIDQPFEKHVWDLRAEQDWQLLQARATKVEELNSLCDSPWYLAVRTGGPRLTDADFARLTSLGFVSSIIVDGATQLSDSALAALSRLGGLDTITIRGCTAVTAAGLMHLAHVQGLRKVEVQSGADLLPLVRCLETEKTVTRIIIDSPYCSDAMCTEIAKNTQIRQLDLCGAPHVTDAGIAAVAAGLENLETLRLVRATKVTDAGFCTIAQLQDLTELHFNGCDRVTGATLDTLGDHKKLATLEIDACKSITNDGLKGVAKLCQTLTVLAVTNCVGVSDAGISSLAALTKVVKLDVSGCKFTNIAIAAMCTLPILRHLVIDSQLINDESVALLLRAEQLQCVVGTNSVKLLERAVCGVSLDVSSCDAVTAGAIAHVTDQALLRHLRVKVSKINFDVALPHLLKLPDRARVYDQAGAVIFERSEGRLIVDFRGNGTLTDAGLSLIAKMPTLKELKVNAQSLSSVGFGDFVFNSKKNIEALSVCNSSAINDHTLSHLSHLKRLRSLSLVNLANSGNATLAHVAAIKSLQELELANNGNYNDGGLAHLVTMSLASFKVKNCAAILSNVAKYPTLQAIM